MNELYSWSNMCSKENWRSMTEVRIYMILTTTRRVELARTKPWKPLRCTRKVKQVARIIILRCLVAVGLAVMERAER